MTAPSFARRGRLVGPDDLADDGEGAGERSGPASRFADAARDTRAHEVAEALGTGRPSIRVIVCDDHAVVRTGLRRLPDSLDGIDVVAIAADGHEALAAVVRLNPDVVLMDLSMPRMDGVAATRAITNATPATRVVVLTSFHHRERIANAIAAGASGYVLKDATPRELEAAIRSAADPRTPESPG